MIYTIECLEARRLLSDLPLVSINAKQNGSETDPADAGLGQFTVRRGGDTSAALHVHVRFSPGASTATVGEDLQRPPTTVRIAPGRSYAHFNIIPIDDAILDPDETVVVKVWNGEYTINPARPKARIRIQDNEVGVSLFRVTETASEDDPSGAGAGRFRVTRTGPTDQPLNVFYYLRATSTATSGVDFQPLPGQVTIPAGSRSADFNLIPIDDDDVEDPETVVLALQSHPSYFRQNSIAQVTILDNDESIQGWWNDQWEFRAPISVSVQSHQRIDKPVEVSINFTQLLTQLNRPGTLVEDSIRVIETTADGLTVLDENVPFQFDKAANYNATTNAAGTLVVLLSGETAANTTRFYHVYFDTQGAFARANITPRITVTDNVMDEGQSSLRISTVNATYFYQKAAGGLSSLVDADGNDWIDFHPDPGSGSAGEFRGIPNMGPAFHPGEIGVTTQIISQGPLKVSVESRREGEQRRVRWDFYPGYATMTVLEFSGNYWFLYEGTPGGSIDQNDYVVRSDGTQTAIDEAWDDVDGLGSVNGAEWAYFGDSGVGKFLFLAHHQTDGVEDSYFLLEDNMTVFGFGRKNNPGLPSSHLLSGSVNTFTIGLSDGDTVFSTAAAIVNGSYRDLDVTLGTPETRTS